MNVLPPAAAADVCLLLVYGAVIGFFLLRWVRFRRTPSLGVAMLPAGWVLVALWDLGILSPHPMGLWRWMGVAFGVWLLASAFRAERGGEQPAEKAEAEVTERSGPG